MPPTPWYAEGLEFSCARCGNCCSGSPGYVDFSPSEAEEMAAFLGIDVDAFLRRYARRRRRKWCLREVEADGGYDCIFLVRGAGGRIRCAVYPVRPEQCRTWPFWPENLRSREAWETAAKDCPGMNRRGEPGAFHPAEEIRRIAEGPGGEGSRSAAAQRRGS